MINETVNLDSFDDYMLQLDELEFNLKLELPVPPQAVIEFSKRSSQSNSSIQELSGLVEEEPTLTTELLRTVNSSLYGFRQKIDSVSQAIQLLGISSCASIFLTKALNKAISHIESPLMSSADARRESLERARFGKEIAARLGFDQNLSHTACCLQDILLPLLTFQFPDSYRRYLNKPLIGLDSFERKEFGWTHSEVTAKTLKDWGFPKSLIMRVLQHHVAPEELFVADGPLSPSTPNAIAALLQDVLRQSPCGVTRLLDLQRFHPKLNLIDICRKVDELNINSNDNFTNAMPLVNRVQFQMLEQIESRRTQSIYPGRQFGSYVLEEKIAESTMGSIFKAKHIMLRRPAAIKFLRADKMNRESIQQFAREVQLTSTLCHPNTVSIFDYGHTPDDLFYYAMEYIDGLTLNELIAKTGPLPPGRVVEILSQICGSLAEAHAHGLVHRDIKPQNILISDSVGRADRITVLDFGLVTTSENSESKTILGTPLYMSPEAAKRQAVDSRSDLYSIGAVGYYLLTGKTVFTGSSLQELLLHHIETTPLPPSAHLQSYIPVELENIILRCLAKDPNHRIQSAIEILNSLASVQKQLNWSSSDSNQWWENFRGHVNTNSIEQTHSFDETLVSVHDI